MNEKAKAKHEKRKAACVANREEYLARIQPELLRLSQELHDGIYAPNQSEYFRHASNPVDKTTILRAFGPWKNVVNACGLTLGDFTYYYARKPRDSSEWKRIGNSTTEEVLQDGRMEREKIRNERLPSRGMAAKAGAIVSKSFMR